VKELGDATVADTEELDPRFVNFVARYGKQTEYCSSEHYPCDETFKRQKVFLANLEEIETANANVKNGGMKKRVTRFADLESEEFARKQATYANTTHSKNSEASTVKTAATDKSAVAMMHKLPTLGELSEQDMAALHAKREIPASAHTRAAEAQYMRHLIQGSEEFSSLGFVNYTAQGFDESFDWRDRISIGPVYSQGMCSGCWAFTTAQVVSDSTAIATGTRVNVSPYHLLSCDNLDSACNTGNMATAYAWINVQDKGVLVAGDFPAGSSCSVAKNEDTRGVQIEGYCEIPPLEGESTVINLMRALTQQSVAVGVNIKPLQLYGGGIVRMADCPPASSDPLLAINHAAVLIGWGYDEESSQGYWIMKNSYDTDWGEDGYAKLSMELGEGGYGTCGLYTEQNYPLTDGRSCTTGSTKKWSILRGSDVYLEPEDVLVLPNGAGLITPFKFQIFGFDLTSTLQVAAMFCFSLCFVLVLIELYFCIFPELDAGNDDGEYYDVAPDGTKASVGSSLLKAEEGGASYGAGDEARAS
jgi:C1A family cysteine protease